MTDEEQIRSLPSRWLKATHEGDVVTIDALMHPDVLFFTAGRPPFGRDIFLQAFRAMQGNVTIEGTADVLELEIDGDHGYAQILLNLTITPKDKPAMQKRGPVLSIYRRNGGTWQLYRDANFVS